MNYYFLGLNFYDSEIFWHYFRQYFYCIVFLVFCLPTHAYELFGLKFTVANEFRQESIMLASERLTRMLPEANGGPSYNNSPLYDPRPTNPITCSDGSQIAYNNPVSSTPINATLGYLTSDALKYGTVCQGVYGEAVPSYAGNINADDWRLNFDKGDLVQAPTSLNSVIEMFGKFSFGEVKGLLNLEALFDGVLTDEGSFQRSALDSEGEDRVARYIRLNGYLSLKTRTYNNRALNIKLGQQQIHWGEKTFLPGGINWFNPLNIPRFRQTGYEHGWIPVSALFSEFVWSRSLSISGYYGGWNRYEFDVPGTYAGIGGDVWVDGAGVGGNQHNFVVGSGSYFTGNSWPCHYNDADYWQGGTINQSTKTYADALAAYAPRCPGSADVLTKLTIGRAEEDRIKANDSWAMIPRGDDEKGSRSYGFMSEYLSRKFNLGVQLSYQGGDARVPMINYYTNQPKIMPYATGVMDSVIGRGATVTGLGSFLLLNPMNVSPAVPYNPTYQNVMMNTDNGLVTTLKNAVPGLNTYGATPGSVAEMNALQYALANNQSVAVTQSTTQRFEALGATYTGAINIRPEFNLGIYGVYPHEDIYGISMRYTGFGTDQSPLFMNIAYRPKTPLQFDLSELLIAGLFNNCMMTSTGAYEPTLLNSEPYHNEFDLALGDNRVGCRDYHSIMPGYTTEYDGWITDLVAQAYGSNKWALRSDSVFGRLQMRAIYAGGISSRADTSAQATINGTTVTGPLMPLDNLCSSGSDLPLSGIVGLDPRPPIICRPTEYSMGLLLGGGLNYDNVMIMGVPYTVSPGILVSRGMVGRSPRPLGAWLKDVGYYIASVQLKNNKQWSYELQYRGYYGPELYNAEAGSDAVFLSMRYLFNLV